MDLTLKREVEKFVVEGMRKGQNHLLRERSEIGNRSYLGDSVRL
jgi:hypothetical protein